MLHSVSHSTCLSTHTASCFSLLNSSSTHTHLTTLFLTQLAIHTQVSLFPPLFFLFYCF
ncbi:hypothetical protein CROQUDRAFT_664270 [Cronartium quercuum f. sp. fusiforme G11]|uniref:Uncharacterized protein n=1 Tax=Cronartium quercuum f. sp. fusiforme G11 TaxID=708437 RepID=A0A9P6N795_9BASI|nr:hypothetical protein CROQUDRAFT_664270 [Cronartium quercuum f. sp. fusiforme G11]